MAVSHRCEQGPLADITANLLQVLEWLQVLSTGPSVALSNRPRTASPRSRERSLWIREHRSLMYDAFKTLSSSTQDTSMLVAINVVNSHRVRTMISPNKPSVVERPGKLHDD